MRQEKLPVLREARPLALQDADPSKRDTVPVRGPIQPDFTAIMPRRRNQR
jgi:hypothetical protein